jgi:DNA (cytosine-5)-methyltransferase 1
VSAIVERLRMGELFCGPGGIAVGSSLSYACTGGLNKQALSIKHAWATDYDQDTCDTYALNICNGAKETVICEDIRKLDLERLRSISEVDALSFGFPCNDFSSVGKQKGINGNFGPLYTYCVEAVDLFKPMFFMAENVSGLKSSNQGKAFEKILDDFSGLGYDLYPHTYSFDKYGVPQARKRIIIIGIEKKYKKLGLIFRPPSPAPYAHIDVSARTALTVPPIGDDVMNNERSNQSKTVVERLKYIKPGQNAFNADIPKELQLNVKGAKISQIYRRLHPDKPAYTVTGSGGGGTHMYHWEENRALTNRERARLQTFPDDFIFVGNRGSVRKQIGMAVPCKGAEIILKSVLDTLLNIDYESIECKI